MDVSKELNEASTKKSFFKHVFDIDDESQKELMNIVQYSLLALIPVVILNKLVQSLFPEADESKTNIELLIEIAGQTIVMFVGMIVIHRLVTYIPTYSKVDYYPFRVTNIVIAFLSIVLSIQSRIGEKANILLDRLTSYVRPQPKQEVPVQTKNNNNQVNIPNTGVNIGINQPYEMQSSLQQPQYNQPMQQQPQQNYNMNNNMNNMGLLNQEDEILAANDGGVLWGSAF
jgi:hypothetical protein